MPANKTRNFRMEKLRKFVIRLNKQTNKRKKFKKKMKTKTKKVFKNR